MQAITQAELEILPTIQIALFNPDYDEVVHFSFRQSDRTKLSFAVDISDNKRAITFHADMNRSERILAMHASEILIDAIFDETAHFNLDNENPTVLYYALHDQCMNFGFYSSNGRHIDGYEQA